jgi:glyoxylate reductase
VDAAAVARALRERSITSAGLDVFEREPQVNPELPQLENGLLAPHIGSASVEARRRMSMLAVENALAAMQGRRPPNLVTA